MNDTIFFRDSGDPHIRDIINIEELTELFQSYSDLTNMATALLDLEGNVLIATNWQDSCTQFHRVNDITSKRCHESDTALAGSLQSGETYNIYQCRNGLVDIAMPVMIEGCHMGNFFTGQFFFKKPDLDYFTKQANEVGFNQDEYLAAIESVPIYDENTIKSHMSFLVRIAEMVGKSGAANLRALQANRELQRHKENLESLVDARTAELKVSLAAAEAANQAKSRFLANMSHELRTPLNAVLGYSDILCAKEQEPAKKRYLESINIAGRGLLNLINSILDLSKIESGKMPVQNAPMSLRALLGELSIIFEKQAAEKDLELSVHVSSTVPEGILFDEVKLRQILINLISNAIKFTRTGYVKVVIEAKPVPQKNDSVDLYCSVTDSGKGICKTDQAHVFEAFEQARDQKISEYGGTGLGLALCKQLVELLGGTMSIKSELDKGSTFTCYFPEVSGVNPEQLAFETISPMDAKGIPFLPATILVVDDNELNRDVLATYLAQWHFNVLCAENGKEAVELAKNKQPDLIFMDMKMPVMDGFEATAHLRSHPETKHIPVVAATASALANEKQKICEITDDYLSKPISQRALIKCLLRFIPTESQGTEKKEQQRVLVVDDDAISRMILTDILESVPDIEAVSVHSSKDAVARACQPDRPSVIFMDYQMPGMNGVELAQKIRDWEADRQISPVRIYLVTAFSEDELTDKQNLSLFDGLVSKPIERDEILGFVVTP